MRTTLDLDAELLERALRETEAKSKTAAIEMGLRALLERGARKHLKALFGDGPRIQAVRRRRPRRLMRRGIGWIDAHLLASALVSSAALARTLP